jgi:glycerol-3-phosphate acyltransferase PlsY
MELVYSILLAVAAFWLGACPFSLWIGKWLAGKDIRNYGDGNPGAVNVFRAAGPKIGAFALILDMAKGALFVALAHLVFNLPLAAVLGIGICSIAGHAFSPLLGLNGGKALAATMGVLLALPQYDILIVMLIMALVGFLIMESDTWAVMIAPPATLVYLLVTKGPSWEALFVLLVLVIWTVKQLDDLRSFPRVQIKPLIWLRARKATHASRHYKE